MTNSSKSDTSSEMHELSEITINDDEKFERVASRLLNSLEPLFESLEQLETNVLANWGTELPDNRVVTVDAGTVRKIRVMAAKMRELVE